MSKEDMMNKISFALKDPILQMGFEVICSKLSRLENENVEMKEQLAKAKEIIEKLYSHIFQGMCFMGINDYSIQKAEAEQFLNEVEKPIESSVDYIIEQNEKEQKRYFNSRLYESQKKKFAQARSKKVICLETGEIYPSASYVEKNIVSGVRDVIKGKQITAGGFHWAYVGEESKKKPPKERKKVICANTGEIFDNTDEAAIFAKVVPGLIKRICNSNKETAGGYTFYYYEGEKEYPIREYKSRKKCNVMCIETGEIFESIKQASNTKSDEVNICKCCKGFKKSHKGLHWKYVNNL